MLAIEERAQIQIFVRQSPPGTPYLRRASIVLMDDEGATQEAIAAELQIPITRVRQMLRAYMREGAALFPDSVWSTAPYRATDPIPDVARLIITGLVDHLEQHEPDLAHETSVTAVHESRKMTRKMRTALELFAPYFEDHTLRSYRKRARKFMRRLGRSRDIAVFLIKLDAFIVEGLETGRLTGQEHTALNALTDYWRDRQLKADARVRRYLAKGKYQRLLADLTAFGRGDTGEAAMGSAQLPLTTAYVAPVMIYEKLGGVRTMGDQLGDLQPAKLHALRITCKELRYTLEFFEGLLGPAAGQCIEIVKTLLTLLGDVNDARVHLEMLDRVNDPELATTVDLYREAVEGQLQYLRESFPGLWVEFDQPEWRERLASAVAVL